MDLSRRRRSNSPSTAEQFLALPDRDRRAPEEEGLALEITEGANPVAGNGNGGGAGMAHPFWSQRARDEAQLQAMRPAGLAEAEGATSGTGSGSTELRLDEASGSAERRPE